MSKLKYFVPVKILKIVYNSLILPHLNYGLKCWGYKLQKISKLQKKAIRIVACKNYTAHTDPIFKQLHIMKVSDIFIVQHLSFYYDLINDRLPSCFSSIYSQLNEKHHNYNTRQLKKCNKLRTNHFFAERQIICSLSTIVNETSEWILNRITTHSRENFIKLIKNGCINKYEEVCNIVNCFSCTANSITENVIF